MNTLNAETMNAKTIYPSLAQAIADGYQIVQATPDGYLMRRREKSGWTIAAVRVRSVQEAMGIPS
jgi:hypothetical protein